MSQTQLILSSEQKFQRRVEVIRIASTLGPQQALIKFGIPIRTIGSWISRFNASGLEGLKDNSRAPHFVANKKDRNGLLGAELERLHEKEPGLNRMQIFSKLFLIASDETPTLSWIARETRRRGLTHQSKIRKNDHKTR